jgi:hypothetical protein
LSLSSIRSRSNRTTGSVEDGRSAAAGKHAGRAKAAQGEAWPAAARSPQLLMKQAPNFQL